MSISKKDYSVHTARGIDVEVYSIGWLARGGVREKYH